MPLSKKYLEDITYKNPLDGEMLEHGYERDIYTGEEILVYGEEKTVKAFVSADASRAYLDNIGMAQPFQKTVMIADKNCDIKVGAIVTYNGTEYLVKKVMGAKCLSYLPVGMDEVKYG